MKVFEEIEHKYKGLAAIEPRRRDKILELYCAIRAPARCFWFYSWHCARAYNN